MKTIHSTRAAILLTIATLCGCSDDSAQTAATVFCVVMSFGACPTVSDPGTLAQSNVDPGSETPAPPQMPSTMWIRPPAHQTQIAAAVPQLRYANQCVMLGRRTDAGDVGIAVTNRCSQDVTVHTIGNGGIDFITVGPGTHNWTTEVTRLDYACFVEPGQQICEK